MVAILHNVRSLHNVGSIFRTADGAGVEKLFLCGITPGPVDRFGAVPGPLAKVSLGAEKSVLWEKVASTGRLLDKLKKDGYQILALELAKGAVPYQKFSKLKAATKKTCLIVGNEVKGIPGPLLKKADKIIEIPMRGEKESLNVSVAFGVAVFKLIYG